MMFKAILLIILSIVSLFFGSIFALVLIPIPLQNENIDINSSVSLEIGQSVSISDQGITVKFIDVLDDSRCPSDVECVWEGTFSLKISVNSNGQNLGNFILNSSNLHKASFSSYYAKCQSLDPYPVSTKIILKSSYSATFFIGEYGPDWCKTLQFTKSAFSDIPREFQMEKYTALLHRVTFSDDCVLLYAISRTTKDGKKIRKALEDVGEKIRKWKKLIFSSIDTSAFSEVNTDFDEAFTPLNADSGEKMKKRLGRF